MLPSFDENKEVGWVAIFNGVDGFTATGCFIYSLILETILSVNTGCSFCSVIVLLGPPKAGDWPVYNGAVPMRLKIGLALAEIYSIGDATPSLWLINSFWDSISLNFFVRLGEALLPIFYGYSVNGDPFSEILS
jgi:hypothetical protein